MKRFWILLATVLFVAPAAGAAEIDADWSMNTVNAGSETVLQVPLSAAVNDHTKQVRCGSEQRCSATMNGTGTVVIYWNTGDTTVYPGGYDSIGVTLTDGDRVVDLVRGRSYIFVLTVDGIPFIRITGN